MMYAVLFHCLWTIFEGFVSFTRKSLTIDVVVRHCEGQYGGFISGDGWADVVRGHGFVLWRRRCVFAKSAFLV